MTFLSRFCRHYLLSLQFFTRIPVTGRLGDWVGYSPAMLRASAGHLPGVGWLVGSLVAGFTALLLACLPDGGFSPLVAAVWGTAFGVLLTGAFHEDGLADVFDGLGGSPDRERALVIMKDSRVGAFGAIAMMLALLSAICMVWISKLESWLPSRQAVAITLKFDKDFVPVEAALRGMANSRGYDIADGTVNISLKEGAQEWRFVAVARSRQKMMPLSDLAQEMAKFSGVNSFNVAYARN